MLKLRILAEHLPYGLVHALLPEHVSVRVELSRRLRKPKSARFLKGPRAACLNCLVKSFAIASQTGGQACHERVVRVTPCGDSFAMSALEGTPCLPDCFDVDLEVPELARHVEVLDRLQKAASFFEGAFEVRRALSVGHALQILQRRFHLRSVPLLFPKEKTLRGRLTARIEIGRRGYVPL